MTPNKIERRHAYVYIRLKNSTSCKHFFRISEWRAASESCQRRSCEETITWVLTIVYLYQLFSNAYILKTSVLCILSFYPVHLRLNILSEFNSLHQDTYKNKLVAFFKPQNISMMHLDTKSQECRPFFSHATCCMTWHGVCHKHKSSFKWQKWKIQDKIYWKVIKAAEKLQIRTHERKSFWSL